MNVAHFFNAHVILKQNRDRINIFGKSINYLY